MTKTDANALPGLLAARNLRPRTYDREQLRVIPLVWIPRVYGLSERVKDWTLPAPGESWPLADVWLDVPLDAANEEGTK